MAKRNERYGMKKKALKRVAKRSIGGSKTFAYRKERTSAAVCNNCGRELHGMPRFTSTKYVRLAKSEKRPNRKFGGYYCANCTREIFRNTARNV